MIEVYRLIKLRIQSRINSIIPIRAKIENIHIFPYI